MVEDFPVLDVVELAVKPVGEVFVVLVVLAGLLVVLLGELVVLEVSVVGLFVVLSVGGVFVVLVVLDLLVVLEHTDFALSVLAAVDIIVDAVVPSL